MNSYLMANAENIVRKNFLLISGILCCFIFFCYWLNVSLSFPIHDFSNSYFGAYFFLKGKFSPDIFDPYTFNRMIDEAGQKNVFGSYSPNSPFTSLFFVLFAWLPVGPSKFVFNVISIVLLLTSLLRLCRFAELPNYLPALIPLVFFIPVRNHILFGQTYFIIFFLLTEGYLAYEKKKTVLASASWSLAILLKIFPAILFLYLLLKKDWKGIIYLGIACLTLFFISLLLQGFDDWKIYLMEYLPRSNSGEIASAYTTNYQSALFLLKYVFVADPISNPNPFIHNPLYFHIGLILFKSVVLSICCSVILNRKNLLAFGVLWLSAMLVTPYGSTYGSVVLIFLFISIMGTQPLKWIIVISVLLLSVANFPIHWSALPIVMQFPRLLLLVLLLTIIFYCAKSRFNFGALVFFIFLFGVAQLMFRKEEFDKSEYLLSIHNVLNICG